MKKPVRSLRLAVLAITGLLALGESRITLAAPKEEAPRGWQLRGDHPEQYETGTDAYEAHQGHKSATLRSKGGQLDGFGTLMQKFKADDYLGKRVRLSAWIKARNVESWAGLWMRIDGQPGERPLAFDNMQRRPIVGTQDWARYEVVLDVSPRATEVALGVLLAGAGELWISEVNVEVVGSIATTTAPLAPVTTFE